MERRTRTADFRGLKTLEDFDWSFNPAIHRKEIFDLATCNSIRQAKDVLFLGPPAWERRTWPRRWDMKPLK